MKKSKSAVKKKLEALNYFQYVSPDNLAAVIDKTFADYKNDGVIDFPWEGLNRVFSIDAEFIYEGDGIKSQIEGMLPMFKAMGIDESFVH